jgi:MFS family permease
MSQRQSTLIALLVAVTFFMENLDATVIATALPQMARTFGVAAVDLNIGMSAYMLAIAAFIPISGWLADRLGHGWCLAAQSFCSPLRRCCVASAPASMPLSPPGSCKASVGQ